jgi:hypothetical protein
MKIIGIDKTQSSADWAVFRTDGEIGEDVARRFKRLYSERSEARGVEMEVRDSLVYVAVVNLPKGFSGFISQLLTEAERAVAHEHEAELQKERLETDQKDLTLQSIADEEGLPIL